MNTDIERRKFMEAGYSCIPLKQLSKYPLVNAWPTKPTLTQWKTATEGSNVGLRAGNGKAFIDCDNKNEPGTSDNVFNWLAGLGYNRGDYPIVQTPSMGGIGRHVYVNFTGSLMNSKRNFTKNMGMGEFRFGPGAYVATFPSILADGGEYKLIEGDIARLPVLDLKDISKLIDINESAIEKKRNPTMSHLAKAICAGVKLDKYVSNSEAEGALVLSLINIGYDYESIKYVFNSNPCMGHYKGKHGDKSSAEANRWLYMTYQNMLAYSKKESPARRQIKEWILLAKASAWSNVTDKNVLLAHLKIAYMAGRYNYHASARTVALGAHASTVAASKSTKRIISKTGILSVDKTGKGVAGTTYILNRDKVVHSLRAVKNEGECTTLSTHDAFRNGGGRYAKGRLGRRAGEVYELLSFDTLTVNEIHVQLGSSIKTIQRALRKLATVVDDRTGEVIEMVACEDGRWKSKLVDLDLIAEIIGTYGATDKQIKRYERERREHAWSLEIGAITKK